MGVPEPYFACEISSGTSSRPSGRGPIFRISLTRVPRFAVVAGTYKYNTGTHKFIVPSRSQGSCQGAGRGGINGRCQAAVFSRCKDQEDRVKRLPIYHFQATRASYATGRSADNARHRVSWTARGLLVNPT